MFSNELCLNSKDLKSWYIFLSYFYNFFSMKQFEKNEFLILNQCSFIKNHIDFLDFIHLEHF